ncbi:MAG: AAA family ATPase [Clostridia bacterium]|jgi:AAA15 family ATPase/GTPase|nr:AAA family ATPase [Clostridia bacterium]
MFTYVKAKNFKSLKDIEFNLNKTKTKTNQFISIYGENGSGKTNIVELFKLLQQVTMARTTDITMNKMPKEFWKIQEEMSDQLPTEIRQIFQLSLNLKEYRMIDEKEATEIEYGFKINNKDGFYYIKFDDEIIEEKLYYMAGKQRAYLFEIKKEDNRIIKNLNNNIFKNEKYNEELIDGIDKYWGKYSFLSLLSFEMIEKNKDYIDNNISNNIFEVTDYIWSMTVHVDKGALRIIPDSFVKVRKLNNIQVGTIKKEKIREIKKYENVLNIFFTQAYADIKEVKYKIDEKEDRIHYELYFNKMIGGQIKSIPSKLESDGTRRILNQFDTIIGSLLGETVILDEIDNGIHDVLMKNIIMSIKDEITGQLIITTHNTLLLEILPKEYIYILSADYNGNKTINSIKEYGIKIQKNNNARDLYFKGVFGGIPTTDYIDFEEIKYTLEDSEDNEENVDGEET